MQNKDGGRTGKKPPGIKIDNRRHRGRLGMWVSKRKLYISQRNGEQRYPRADNGCQEQVHGLKPYGTQITKSPFFLNRV